MSLPVASIQNPEISSHLESNLKAVFAGPNGLRAGWRLLMFVVLAGGLVATWVLIRNGGIQGFQEAKRHQAEMVVTPFLMGGSEGVVFVILCFATWIMAKIERRKFGEYGLALRRALGKELWIGWLCGFSAISGTLLVMFLLHGFRITGMALHGTAILNSVVSWLIVFVVVGLCEEFLCRGYMQYTLAAGIRFWPAAFVMSSVFAFGHVFNANETAVGVASVVGFGLLLSLFLRRTGALWCAVGFHAAYDFGQTFYGVPDSGIAPYHNVFQSVFSGPSWLTGGAVGPEASVLTPIALVAVALIFGRFYRENRYKVI